MVREQLPIEKRAQFNVKIEDEDGREIYRAALHIEAKTAEDLATQQEEAEAAAQDIAANLAKGPRD